jgi:hypothetical protein
LSSGWTAILFYQNVASTWHRPLCLFIQRYPSDLKASGELNLINIFAIFGILAVVFLLLGLGKWIPLSLNPALFLTVFCYGYIIVDGLDKNKKRRPK